MTHRIAVIAGDGIGPEVIGEAIKVVRAAGVSVDTVEYDLGGVRYLRNGEVLPDGVLDELRGFDAILLGAIGTPDVPPGVLERGLLLRMPHEVATQGSVNTRMGVERCIRFAFDLATKSERHHLTMVHKTNVLTFAGDLWQRTFDEVAADFPDITTAYNHVDAACIYMVERPEAYDVLVTDNLFGDILTDLAGAVAGGIGLAASANLNPARTGPSLFEPVHGSAPDIVGTGKANPIAAVRSAAMMLDFLGEADAAARITKSVEDPTAFTGTTAEIGDAISERV